MSMFNNQTQSLMQFSIDITMSANTAFYPKFQDTFAATLHKPSAPATIREPTVVHEYNPVVRPPIKPPPKNLNPDNTLNIVNQLQNLPQTVMKTAVDPVLGWFGSAAKALTEAGGQAFKFAEKAAPFALDAAEMLIPMLLEGETLVSA